MSILDPNDIRWKGFSQSMREKPGNDAVRLAFADWVEEVQGGVAFAGLIRSMVKVSETDPDNELNCVHWKDRRFPGQTNWQQYADAERYLKSVWPVWSPLNLLHPACRNMWRFQRGFPSKVVIDWRGLKWLDSLIAIGPIGEVEVVSHSPVTADFHSHTICFYLNDSKLEQRLASGSFVVPIGEVPPGRRMYQAATERFLEMIWGKQVGRIWYSTRPDQKVWPTVPGQGVLLPWQDPLGMDTEPNHSG